MGQNMASFQGNCPQKVVRVQNNLWLRAPLFFTLCIILRLTNLIDILFSTASFCEKPCTREYLPKCGTDGTTYNNQCLLQIAMCKNGQIQLASDGPCPEIGKLLWSVAMELGWGWNIQWLLIVGRGLLFQH